MVMTYYLSGIHGTKKAAVATVKYSVCRPQRQVEYRFVPGLRLLVCVFCCLLVAGSAEAATRVAATCSLSDIQTQVNASSAGDTVTVPAGTATWSGSLTVNKNISVIGAGTNNTVITCSGSALSMGTTAAGVCRLSGFSFVGGSGGKGIYVAMSPTNYVRVDHCFFQGFQHGFYWYGIGLIDHCTFLNPTYLGFVQCPSPAGNPTSAQQNWVRDHWYPVPMDTTNALFLEDCTITWTSFNNSDNYVIQSYQAASYIVRYCTINMNVTDSYQQFWDYHGNQGNISDPNVPRGSIAIGVYGNTLNHTGTSSSIQWVYARAGSGLVFSNTLNGTVSSSYNLIQEEDADGSKGYTGPPYFDMNTNIWIWANGKTGVSYQSGTVNGVSCSVNTTAPSPLLITPYPHPLVAAQDAGQTNAILSITPSSLDFGSVSIGSSSNLTFTAQNTGGGILAGVASVAAPFSIVAGSPYSLGAGRSQAVTVRYSPTAVSTDTQNVAFTGGGGAIIPVSGTGVSAAAKPGPPTNLRFAAQ